ncbi:hypothetical protein [Phenylobacterium sp.]|jgi:hypothetical protein|uniref:hypothetical protein n=1 Tax=Phenylobacterium sp. TaxID=1871053 RepID=UPI002E34DA0B|nr:hypothetical protein [Phenylobacterium sp.]HEX2561288.1 hypothetical protein [Phenylobacterium sp.]
MKIAIVQFDTRPLPQLGDMLALLVRNKAYAEAHGYDYRFLDKAYFDLPVYWQKPQICRHYLAAGYDAVAWLDTDAVVHDLARPIETLFESAEAMVGAGDNPYWSAPFNAGVFLVRGSEGAAILERWSALFAGTKWRRTETAWVCEDEWAGPSYEQGAFCAGLLPELTASGVMRLEHWRTLQSPFPTERALTLHFAGPFKANLPAYLELIGSGD